MIRCSLNELFHMTRKALLGCGFSHDVADDTGWAMVIASHHQPRAATQLAAYLAHYQAYDSARPVPADSQRITIDGTELRLTAAPHEMLVFGAMICDWLAISSDGGAEPHIVILTTAYMPSILLGQLIWTESQHHGQITLSFDACQMHADEMLMAMPASGEQGNITEYRIEMKAGGQQKLVTETGAVDIDDTGWARLSEFAFRSYVPESDASRLSGAGAGLTDND